MKTLIRNAACRASCFSLLMLALAAQAHAQTLSRAEVKAQTTEARKKHQLLPAGEAGSVPELAASASTTTRAQRKTQTTAARASGDLLAAGERSTTAAERRTAASSRSAKTRAQRKAETLQAIKAKEILPAGEAAATSR